MDNLNSPRTMALYGLMPMDDLSKTGRKLLLMGQDGSGAQITTEAGDDRCANEEMARFVGLKVGELILFVFCCCAPMIREVFSSIIEQLDLGSLDKIIEDSHVDPQA